MTAAAARELGLAPGMAAATSLIDADAGWLGSVLCHKGNRATRRRDRRRTERAACNGCVRGAHLQIQHLTDVRGASALPHECGALVSV